MDKIYGDGYGLQVLTSVDQEQRRTHCVGPELSIWYYDDYDKYTALGDLKVQRSSND